jgi:hypothetical protein
VTYRSPLHEVSWDKSARRKFSSDLDLTLRICLARDALWYGGHPRPLSFITEQLNRNSWSGRHQGWTIQDVESRLKPFRNELVPEDEQPWPAFVAGWLEQTDAERYTKALEAYCQGHEVRFCFKASGSTETCRKTRKRARTARRGLIVDSKSAAIACALERDWRRPWDGTTRLEWFAGLVDEWARRGFERLSREAGGLPGSKATPASAADRMPDGRLEPPHLRSPNEGSAPS